MVNVLLDSLKKTRENKKIMFLDKKNRNKSREMIFCVNKSKALPARGNK